MSQLYLSNLRKRIHNFGPSKLEIETRGGAVRVNVGRECVIRREESVGRILRWRSNHHRNRYRFLTRRPGKRTLKQEERSSHRTETYTLIGTVDSVQGSTDVKSRPPLSQIATWVR